jgi:hypothetical protein
MEGNVSYKIIPELKLILEIFGGKVVLDEFIKLKKKETEDSNYSPDFNFIISLRDLKSDTETLEGIKGYVDFVRENKRIPGNRKTVILTDTPNQVVVATLYESEVRELPMNLKIVSTLKAALQWVGLSAEFEKIIDKYLKSV